MPSTQLLSHVRLFAAPWTIIACQAPTSMGFSRQKYWNGLPLPTPEDLPHPGVESTSLTSPPLAGGFSTTSATWEARQSQEGPLVIVQGKSHSHGLKLKLLTVNIHSFSETSTLCLPHHPIYTPGRRKPYGWPQAALAHF